jgi:HEAT repeat protein
LTEPRLAELAKTAPTEIATAVVSRLGQIGTQPAREAIRAGFDSPHLEVRVAAIALLPDMPADTVRAAMSRLFEDPDPAVRLEALEVVKRLGATAVGPALVRRVQSAELHALPVDERRALFETIAKLNPRRAEAVAIEVLNKHQLVPSHEPEVSRALACEALAAASSPEALAALEDASRLRPWNSKPVREAASQAAATVNARRSLPPPGSFKR